MNCVNCGAPPQRGEDQCLYCQTDLGTKTPEADHGAYERALKAFQDCDWDTGRETQAKMLGIRGTALTAGQARRLASTCDWDSGRLAVLTHLYPNVISPVNLLECSDIFDWDTGRDQLAELITHGKLATQGRSPRAPQVPSIRGSRNVTIGNSGTVIQTTNGRSAITLNGVTSEFGTREIPMPNGPSWPAVVVIGLTVGTILALVEWFLL